jgi:hypothetical protein
MPESTQLRILTPSEHFSVFISSPSGMDEEKSIIIEEIRTLSEQAAGNNTPSISVAAWPADIAAGAAGYGQAVINRQTSHHDIFVCLVGTHMGTPTPRANSGTEEEFDRAIEAILNGHPVQVLLFFSNLLARPQSLDPHQLLLVRAFREKAGRLGVLYHTYTDHDQLRHLFRISLREAYQILSGSSEKALYSPKKEKLLAGVQPHVIRLSDVTLSNRRNRNTAPQWADSYTIPLAEYRRQNIRLTWKIKTPSSYFRFGFKYYDSRELLFSAGSVQTMGQNILFHVGKNRDNPVWFATAYRAGYRLGPDLPLVETNGRTTAGFAVDISATDVVRFSLDGQTLHELFFPIDGIPILAILGWGDENDFLCDVCDLTLHVWPEPGGIQ